MKKIIFVIGKVFITGGLFMISWILESSFLDSASNWLNDKWKEQMHEE